MSAERECFKAMSQLVSEKREFDHAYLEKGKTLVNLALKEFMADHPEVAALHISMDPHNFCVTLKGEEDHPAKDSAAISDPKLSVCLKALETNFTNLKDVLHHVFGNFVDITVTHRYIHVRRYFDDDTTHDSI